MTLRKSVAIILIAGIVGAFIGRAVPRDAPKAEPAPGASTTPSVAPPAGHSCDAEHAELASTKTQLAICKAFDMRVPEPEPSSAVELEPTDPISLHRSEEIMRNRKRLDSYSEAVIVQHFDGRTGVYKPDEWPIDGDGIIIARKLPSGDMAWYGGPDAGPRSDPAAFRVPPPRDYVEPIIERAPDGTIMINGEPVDNAAFGRKVQPEQEQGEVQ
jgi:hypothetical protein